MLRSPGLGVPGPTLMANAGRAVARAVQARFRPCRTLVLCGPGNNGGDGYVAARLLAQQGWPVAVAALAPPRAGSDAADAARNAGPARTVHLRARSGRAPSLVIDAVFGAGLARDVDGLVADTLRAARRVVAVDVPSGLDGATGAVRGFAPAGRADRDLLPPQARPPAAAWSRALRARSCWPISACPAARARSRSVRRPSPTCRSCGGCPHPVAEGHKYSRGHVTVLGGATMTGAARLAADAARRGGRRHGHHRRDAAAPMCIGPARRA